MRERKKEIEKTKQTHIVALGQVKPTIIISPSYLPPPLQKTPFAIDIVLSIQHATAIHMSSTPFHKHPPIIPHHIPTPHRKSLPSSHTHPRLTPASPSHRKPPSPAPRTQGTTLAPFTVSARVPRSYACSPTPQRTRSATWPSSC